ncbi:hypothetical protein RHO12_07675 [Orbus sturtevantii]|uniref:hypothetical protein n=1 Tax=Orbus sturtevantii TaxID=3074109 RepID=UPI00370DD510
MKIKLLISCIFILILAGCATTAKYEKILDSWVGASEQQLIESWGIPDGTYEAGNLKFLSYRYSDQRILYGSPPVYVSNVRKGRIYTDVVGGTPDMIVSNWCKTTFTIEKEKVIKWTFNGNSCIAN